MRSITPVLIDYWHRLPSSPVHQRRHNAHESCNRVREGRLPVDALLPSFSATPTRTSSLRRPSAYVGSNHDGAAARRSSIDDAIEWVRRGLALNRGAVFAALLAAGDPRINARLLPLRLTLGHEDVSTVCRRVDHDARRPTRKFLREWIELLGVDDQDVARRRLTRPSRAMRRPQDAAPCRATQKNRAACAHRSSRRRHGARRRAARRSGSRCKECSRPICPSPSVRRAASASPRPGRRCRTRSRTAPGRPSGRAWCAGRRNRAGRSPTG